MTKQYQDWLKDNAEEEKPSTVASLTRSTSSDSVMDLDLTVTLNLGTYVAQALNVNYFSVARQKAALHETVDSATESEDSTPMSNNPSQGANTPIEQALQAPTDDTESHRRGLRWLLRWRAPQ